MSSSLTIVGIALANVACSVSLVLVNKAVFSSGFDFPMSLTCLHFAFTVVFYRILASCGFFEMRPIAHAEAFKIAAFGVGSIGFMNISLHLNSVGFYQITKLAIVPCTLAMQVHVSAAPTHPSRQNGSSIASPTSPLARPCTRFYMLCDDSICMGVIARRVSRAYVVAGDSAPAARASLAQRIEG